MKLLPVTPKIIGDVIAAVLVTGAHSAVKFMGPSRVVRATREFHRRSRSFDNKDIRITLSISRPNYKEVEMVKLLKKAGEPFPVKKIITRMPPKARVKKKKR